jgi:hypothetical protein
MSDTVFVSTVTSPDTKHNENQQIQSECRLIDKEDSECLTSPQISRGDIIPDESQTFGIFFVN